MEGLSFSVAFREFNKTRGSKRFLAALFDSRDPTIPVVLLEDTGAVFGLLFAFVAVVVTTITGDARFDGIGSIAIGTLLCVIGVALARDTRSLLIGEGITDEMRQQVLDGEPRIMLDDNSPEQAKNKERAKTAEKTVIKNILCIKFNCMQGWFMLYSTKNYLEANIIKGKLEENNIRAVILNKQDTNYVSIGEIELYVPAHLKDIAVHLIDNTLFN